MSSRNQQAVVRGSPRMTGKERPRSIVIEADPVDGICSACCGVRVGGVRIYADTGEPFGPATMCSKICNSCIQRMDRAVRAKSEPKIDEATMVTVCAACSQASCWQAVFMCDRSQNANVKQMSVGELRALDLENECYWDIDPNTGVSREGGLR